MRGVRVAVAVWTLAVLAAGCARAGDANTGGGGGGLSRTAATATAEPATSTAQTAGGGVGPVASPPASLPAQVPTTTTGPAVPTPSPPPTTAAAPVPLDVDAARAVALAFMREWLGMTEPVARAFELVGADGAQVAVEPAAAGELGAPGAGAPTMVLLERLSDEWAVTGTRAGNIVVEHPTPHQRVTSPLRLTGHASAFEGTVKVQVKELREGQDVVLGSGFVTGRGDGQLGPFEGTVSFSQPATGDGWIAFTTVSAASGQVLEATTVRVSFD